MKVQYKNYLKKYSRSLRNNPTLSEKILWQQLKGRQIQGFQFSRQKPIGNYIADFYCFRLKLVIEIDGVSHIGRENKDKEKQNFIESLGFTVLRFTDYEVQFKFNNVLAKINEWVLNKVTELNTTP